MWYSSVQTNDGLSSDREGLSKEAEGDTSKGAERRPSEEGQGAEKGPSEGAAVKSVIHGIKSFVNTISSHEGAELPW